MNNRLNRSDDNDIVHLINEFNSVVSSTEIHLVLIADVTDKIKKNVEQLKQLKNIISKENISQSSINKINDEIYFIEQRIINLYSRIYN